MMKLFYLYHRWNYFIYVTDGTVLFISHMKLFYLYHWRNCLIYITDFIYITDGTVLFISQKTFAQFLSLKSRRHFHDDLSRTTSGKHINDSNGIKVDRLLRSPSNRLHQYIPDNQVVLVLDLIYTQLSRIITILCTT